MKIQTFQTLAEQLQACDHRIREGRRVQLHVTSRMMEDPAFESWIQALYQQYEASRIRQLLTFKVPVNSTIQSQLHHWIQVAALKQLKTHANK